MLRMHSRISDLHIFDPATAKRAYRQFLCEMDSVAWRRRIISPLICQATGGSRQLPTAEYFRA